jgi:hypothetical protein
MLMLLLKHGITWAFYDSETGSPFSVASTGAHADTCVQALAVAELSLLSDLWLAYQYR